MWSGSIFNFKTDFPNEVYELESIKSKLALVEPSIIQAIYNVFKST